MFGLSLKLSEGSPPVLAMQGELDLANADEFAAELRRVLALDSTTIVDMTELTFVDAAGLRALLGVSSQRNGAGPLTLLNAERVAWILDLVGLDGASSLHLVTGQACGR